MQRASLPLRLFQRSVGAPLLPRRQLSAALPQRSAPKRHEAAAELDPKKSENLSFIQRVKVAGVNALYGAFTSGSGYDAQFKGLKVTSVETGRVEAKLVVEPHLANSYGTLHGGAASTIVDIVGTMALLSKDPTRAGVSVEINTSYLASVPVGEEVTIVGTLLKGGRRLGFTSVNIYRADGKMAVTGRHTKAL